MSAPAEAAGLASSAIAPAAPRRGRLFVKYVVSLVGLVAVLLIGNGALDVWFSYNEAKQTLVRIQQEKAEAAAQRIAEFVDEIERQIGWTTHAQWSAGTVDQRRFDYVRLLRQVPAITELAQLDAEGHEQLKVSRLAMDVVGAGTDYSQDPKFTQAVAHKVWFSPVYFRKESEPYMTIAVAHAGRKPGVTVADVNLKLIWDVVSAIKVGRAGYAYVVGPDGRLIAHPDISLVLRDTDLSGLPQVAAALANPTAASDPAAGVTIAPNSAGVSVLTAHAAIPALNWLVFVELPASEALAPLYQLLTRSGILLGVGLLLAAVAGGLLARRMVVPIRRLQEGAERLGAGELGHRIELKTGDEIEALADRFNRMGAQLQESYATLEAKVEVRTRELSESLDQQTATADVLKVISRSPGDLQPVFATMLENATRICRAEFGRLVLYDGKSFTHAAVHGATPEYARFLEEHSSFPGSGTALDRMASELKAVHLLDIAAAPTYRAGHPFAVAAVELGGARSQINVPLLKEDTLIGALVLFRKRVEPFTEKQIELVTTFADQAVIAIENSRLLGELRTRNADLAESLDRQTATSEVLRAISRSPGDLQSVFATMLENATRICQAEFGRLALYDGETFINAAVRGASPEYTKFLEEHPNRRGSGGALDRMASELKAVHLLDIAAGSAYRSRNPFSVAAFELGGARTMIAVPLLKEHTLIGGLVLFRKRVEAFTEKQIELVTTFADQAVIAIENSRLLGELRTRNADLAEALERQTATSEVLRAISQSPSDTQPVFDAIAVSAQRLCEGDFGVVIRYDGELAHLVALHGMEPGEFAPLKAAFPSKPVGLLAEALEKRSVVHAPDITVDPRSHLKHTVASAGGRAFVFVPMLREGSAIGSILVLRRQPRAFTDAQIELLKTFADQAVIAIENARLLGELRQRNADLAEALEYQTATSEVLRIVATSPDDLQPVFAAMLEKATELCAAKFGALLLYDGETYRAVATKNMPPAVATLFGDVHRPEPNTATARILATKQPIAIEDLRQDIAYIERRPLRTALVEQGGARAQLVVPLLKKGEVIGAFLIYLPEPRPFADTQVALVTTFADQAVIAIENARLISETREALDQQTATAEVLQVINASPGDLKPVFEAMLEKAMRLCDASLGMLHRSDGKVMHPLAVRGATPAMAEMFRHPIVIDPGSALDSLLGGERVIHIPDVIDTEAYRSGVASRRRLVEQTGARTALWVALRKDDTLLGVIVIYRREVRPFTEKQIALVTTFADQAVIAIENARLLGELRSRNTDLAESLEQQTVTGEVLKVISRSTFDLTPVFQTLAENAVKLCAAERAIIFRFDGKVLRPAAWHNASAELMEYVERNPIAPGRHSVSARAALERRTVQIADVQADPEYSYALFDIDPIRTLLAVPMLKANELVGVITIYRLEVKPFTDKQIALVTIFADQAVIAIENVRLFEELRERSAELARSVEELTTLREVGEAVSSTLDLTKVLETIVARAVALGGAEAGAIYRYRKSDHQFRFGTFHGFDAELAARIREAPIREAETFALARAIQQRAPVQVPDLEAAPHLPLRDLMVAAGFRSVLMVPLHAADRVFGVLSIQKKSVGEFPESTVKVMQTFASQSVLAIQNARLFREVEEQGQALALASQHKSQFLANMSHELRTPLNAVLGYAELLADGIYGELGERARGVLERIQTNGKHLLGLINDVLDLSKIEAGQLTLAIDDYAMPAVVHSVVSATESLAKAKGLTLVTSVPRVLPMARGDERRLTQVLLNLVGNAIKFTDKGSVGIEVTLANNRFELAVKDTGPGIAKADQARIFEEFQQVDNSNTRQKGGTGLGLAISKRIVEMHGGTLTVDSEPGKGSTFLVTVPVQVEPAKEVA